MRLVSESIWAILTIYGEARGESREGKIAVAEVILNRTRRKYSSAGTVASTVLWPLQFSCWNATDPNRRIAAILEDTDPIALECMEAWATAQAGSMLTHNAVLYYAPSIVMATPSWVTNAELVAEIGHHRFYVPRLGG